ncbi:MULTISPECIES: lysophospholipid acyltransferase family protein [Salimicrobium]|uniref:Glycerol acyltransferase n=1 Tax=Salimicrobium humidisoli TaxID=2029857 RepID=A0ABX4HPQ2_9BACI|nr:MULTISPECIES: lysophospholipid acyltransferase family protein [Salimicrobium]PBB05166.1 glycerol acyltransferase [Salimicrobium humidisoli]
MKYPNKNRWIESGFRRVSRTLIRRQFHNVYIAKDSGTSPSYGLFLINHSSWWDGLLLHLLNDKVLQTDSHIMIDEEGMERFPVFSRVGGFSVDHNSLSHTRQALLYTEKLLKEKKGVFLFPQGGEKHQEARPLRFQKGAGFIIRRCPTEPVTPVVIYYSFGHNRKPEAYIQIGPAQKGNVSVIDWEKTMEQQLDSLKQKVMQEEFDSFKALL